MIVLDTHALLWWVNGDTDQLSARASLAIQAELDRPMGQIAISSISAWELAMLVKAGSRSR